jgi:hypothetical protein
MSVRMNPGVGGAGGAGSITVSAGAASANLGNLVFSNSNGVSFGLNGSTVTASAAAGAGGVALSAGTQSVSTGTVAFSNSNGVTFGMSGSNTITASVAAQSVQTVGLYAVSNTTQSSTGTVDARSLSFAGAGVASVGVTAGTVVVSVAAGAQTNQTMGLYGLGNTTQNSSTTLDARSLSFDGLGIVTVGYSNGSIQLSASTAAQTNQSVGIYASSNTTGQSSSSTYDARSLTIQGYGIISVGNSGGVIQISAPSAVNLTQFSGGMSTGGNTTGTTGNVTGQVILAGGNNIMLSGSTNAGSMTITISGQALNVSAAGGTSNNLSGLTFSNLNGVSFGLSTGASVGTLTASVAAQTNQTAGFYAVGNTTQNSSTTLDARTLSFDALGAMTMGFSNGSIQVSAPATSSLVGVGGITVSTAGSTISVSQIGMPMSYFEPSANGVTMSQSNLNGTVYIQPFVISAPISLYRLQMLGQVTTQPQTTFSVSGSISAAVASSGTGVWGQSGTVLLMSRASTGTVAQSTNLISFYSTTYSYEIGQSLSLSQSTNASSATVSWTTSGAMSYIGNINSTGGVTTTSFGTSGSMSFSSTSALGSTFSSSTVFSFASQVMSGLRPILVPVNTSLTPGEYWLAHIQSSSSASTNYSLQNVASVAPGLLYFTSNSGGYAEIGSTASIAGSNVKQGWGSYSSSGNTTTTLAMSAISGMSQMQLWFNMMAATK